MSESDDTVAPTGPPDLDERHWLVVHEVRLRGLVDTLAFMPLAFPGTMIGMALIATEPLTRNEAWTPFGAGELRVFVAGEVDMVSGVGFKQERWIDGVRRDLMDIRVAVTDLCVMDWQGPGNSPRRRDAEGLHGTR